MEDLSEKLSCNDVMSRLKGGQVFLHELPSMRTSSFALYFSKRLNRFVYTSAMGNSISDPVFIEPSKFPYFFKQTKHSTGYTDSLFREIDLMHPILKNLEYYIELADGIMYQLKQEPDSCFELKSGLLIQHKPIIEWYGMSKSNSNKLIDYCFSKSTVYRLIINNLLSDQKPNNIVLLSSGFRARSVYISDAIVQNIGQVLKSDIFYFLDELNACVLHEKDKPVFISFADTVSDAYDSHKNRKLFSSLLKCNLSFFRNEIFEKIKTEGISVSKLSVNDDALYNRYEVPDLPSIFNPTHVQNLCKMQKVHVQCGLTGFHETINTEDGAYFYSSVQRMNFEFEEKFKESYYDDGFLKISLKNSII